MPIDHHSTFFLDSIHENNLLDDIPYVALQVATVA
jgi:hypothetical protein